MIKFFRQSYAVQYVVIVLLAIALWIPTLISGSMLEGLASPVTPLFNVADRLLGHLPILQHGFAFLLILFEALILNAILTKHQIVGKVGSMGAFVFVLLMSLTPTQTNFYPFTASVIFILLVIKNLFEVYQNPTPEMNLLKAGVCVALASMCYFPSILLLVWIFIALPIAQRGTLRLQFIPLFGFFFVYFAYFVGVYLFGDFLAVYHGYVDTITSTKFSVTGFNLKIIILLFVLIVATFLSLFGGSNAGFEKAIAVRTKISMVWVMLGFALLMLFLGGGNVLMHGLLFIVLTILLSYAFSYLGNTGWANLFLTLFLILVFVNHYYFKIL